LFLLAAGIAQAQDPAMRSIANTVVTIDVTPPVAPPSGWAFWVAKGQLQTTPLISHRCTLETLFEHLEGMREHTFPFSKVMLVNCSR
jgi:hypothetical protein